MITLDIGNVVASLTKMYWAILNILLMNIQNSVDFTNPSKRVFSKMAKSRGQGMGEAAKF